jgi:hypothetical protein
MVVIERKRRKSDERQKTGERGVKRTLRSRTFHPQSINAYASDFSLFSKLARPSRLLWLGLIMTFVDDRIRIRKSDSVAQWQYVSRSEPSL